MFEKGGRAAPGPVLQNPSHTCGSKAYTLEAAVPNLEFDNLVEQQKPGCLPNIFLRTGIVQTIKVVLVETKNV